MAEGPMQIAFVCVRNAGRSQLALSYTQRRLQRSGLDDAVSLVTGGTYPADEIHTGVHEVLEAEGFELEGRTPRQITEAELLASDIIVTMGCEDLELPDDLEADVHAWELPDPAGEPPRHVLEIAEEVDDRVRDLLADLEPRLERQPERP
ncbi:low molecular weight phosphatase family protein [Thermoplasmatales archaeon SW_10_69_26]|nr:MAG: low molecular weight phosphatase family protein [Thermoplasmatales archaeon SW_10_69_26]